MNRPSNQRRYVLDARPAMTLSTGVGNYVCGLAQGFAELTETPNYSKAGRPLPPPATSTSAREEGPAEKLVLFTSSWRERPGPELQVLAQSPSIGLRHQRLPVRALNFSWHHFSLPKIERLVGPVDVAHSPHPLLLPAAHAAQVVTVHDLYFLDHPQHTFGEVRRDYGVHLWRSLAQAQAVLCVSAATKRDLLTRAEASNSECSHAGLEAKTYITPNGVDRGFFAARGDHSEQAGDPSSSRAEQDYYLAVGRIEPRKNPARILEAFASEALQGRRLLWAGMPADATTDRWLTKELNRLGIKARVEVLGYVDRSVLRNLYQGAQALLFPSLHEGFGLPILEAMAAGCPVLTSNTSAMPEVAGDAAVLVDPLSVVSIVDGVLQLEQPERRRVLIERGKLRAEAYTWRATAQSTLAVYRSLSQQRPTASTSARS